MNFERRSIVICNRNEVISDISFIAVESTFEIIQKESELDDIIEMTIVKISCDEFQSMFRLRISDRHLHLVISFLTAHAIRKGKWWLLLFLSSIGGNVFVNLRDEITQHPFSCGHCLHLSHDHF